MSKKGDKKEKQGVQQQLAARLPEIMAIIEEDAFYEREQWETVNKFMLAVLTYLHYILSSALTAAGMFIINLLK